MKILISGILGYLGSRLATLLRDKYEIIGIDNGFSAQLKKIEGITFHNIDIRDYKKVENLISKVNIVIHLAAISGVDLCRKNPTQAHSVNVLATSNISWLCKNFQIPLIFPTSFAMLGDPSVFPIDEKHPRNPKNLYGWTKYMAEQNIILYAKNSFPAIMFMTSNIYGHHIVDENLIFKSTVINKFIKAAKLGDKIVIYKPGTQARDFIHVDDVANVYFKTIKNINKFKNEATIMALANGKSMQINEVAAIILKEAQKHGYNTEIELTNNPRKDETLINKFDINISKIWQIIKFKPDHSIKEEIKKIFEIKN